MKISVKGYTLVELVMVIGIISVISFLAIIIASRFLRNNKINTAKSQMMALRLSLKSYLSDTNTWPVADGSALGITPDDNTQWNLALITGTGIPNWHGPYALAIPNDPWEHRYIYSNYSLTGARFSAIVCQGPLGNNGAAPYYAIADPYLIANKTTYRPDRQGFSQIPGIGSDGFSIILWME
ncbi:MAG: type II secretion system protein GspG [Elusimicrobia bacterium]|nr:type II secretion system protein GspG [Elusimicrobiota bacterium]